MAPLLPVALFTACWYWTSSINAVATQKLLSHLLTQQQGGDGDISVPSLALLLTTLQLAAGSLLCLPFVLLGRRYAARQGDGKEGAGILGGRKRVSKSQILVGLLHCVGCLCTNIGFGYGSASLVQVIKLLEPIETLLLAALAHVILTRRSTGGSGCDGLGDILSPRKVAGTIVIVLGTSALLFQKSMKANPTSVVFAIGSGFCMASRNVLKKSSKASGGGGKGHGTAPSDPPSKSTPKTFGEAFLGGIENFASITVMSAIPAILCIFLAMVSNVLPPKKALSVICQYPPNPNLLRAVLFHCGYNLFSISVLSLTSAPVHSLLNVGKRIANVLTAAAVFSVPLTMGGKVGIVFAAFGAVLYKDDPRSIFSMQSRQLRQIAIFGLAMAAMFLLRSQANVHLQGYGKPPGNAGIQPTINATLSKT